MAASVVAWVGLGSNEGDGLAQLRLAAKHLAEHPDLGGFSLSPLYRTRPWGVTDQPDFINAVGRLHTSLAPAALLDVLLALEQEMGRKREGRPQWGPRLIDLDLLLFGDQVIKTGRLTVPHPYLHERAFALAPMLDLDTDVAIPGHGLARECLARIGREGVVPIDDGVLGK